MHTLESYALTCGAKIDKPYIYKSFFPSVFEKFIIFCPENRIPAKDYSYWQDVINIISPKLQENDIKILQIGGQGSLNYNGVVNLSGRVTINQIAYLIENSMLFFGINGLESQIASSENKPIVSINSISYAENNGPFFGNKKDQLVFESFKRIGNSKPSFNEQENPKSINSINPEEIADAIFQKLNINFVAPFQTVFKGNKYSHFVIQESIPDNKNINLNPDANIEIRADIEMNEESLTYQLSQYKKCYLITDNEININLLKKFKKHILSLIFKVTEKDCLDFLESLKSAGIPVTLISDLPPSKLEKLKIKYYSFGFINPVEKPSEETINSLKKNIDSLFYRSSKMVSSNNKLYYSLAAREKEVPATNNLEYQKVIDSPSFWDNIDFFTLVKLNP